MSLNKSRKQDITETQIVEKREKWLSYIYPQFLLRVRESFFRLSAEDGPCGLKIFRGFAQSLHADVGRIDCIVLHEVRGSHSGVANDSSLPGCYAVSTGKLPLTLLFNSPFSNHSYIVLDLK